MPLRVHPGPVLFLALALPAAGRAATAAVATAPPELQRGWELITQYRFNEAEALFRGLAARDPVPVHRLALAVGLLNRQPKTAGTIDEARQLFAGLGEDPAADAETRAAARYHLARILQVHQERPDPAAARVLFQELAGAPEGGFWAEAARVKWATLLLYEATAWSEKPARLAAIEPHVAALASPTLRKDLHIILADGYEKFRVSDADALRHLEAAWALGIERGIDQGDFLARMGELARRTGDGAKARGYFGEFLRRFRRDERVYWIRRKLEELEAVRT